MACCTAGQDQSSFPALYSEVGVNGPSTSDFLQLYGNFGLIWFPDPEE